MIQITSMPIGEGCNRIVYLHPLDNNKIIKISKTDGMDAESKREIKYYNKLMKRDNINWEHLPKFYGVVETNRGSGIVVELIRDYDGGISKQLDYYIKENSLETYENEWEQLKLYLIEQNIVIINDITPENILLKRIDKDKSILILVDGMGDTVFIDVLNYSDYLLKRKILRRFARAEEKLRERYGS